ncbi:12354_t:CDS:2, partial [Dentiscutata heterogama]
MSLRYEQEINSSLAYNTRSVKTIASSRVIRNKPARNTKSEVDPYPNPPTSTSKSTARACPKCKESSNCINMLNKEFHKIEELVDLFETNKVIEIRNRWLKTLESYSTMSFEDLQRQVMITTILTQSQSAYRVTNISEPQENGLVYPINLVTYPNDTIAIRLSHNLTCPISSNITLPLRFIFPNLTLTIVNLDYAFDPVNYCPTNQTNTTLSDQMNIFAIPVPDNSPNTVQYYGLIVSTY